ncbi:MAG: glycosyltransferase [Planctomycetes bacterium]|jgi:mannosylfructose-phosphate synthase|nr:glycosyltransferase [Planctomycetota bacterium]
MTDPVRTIDDLLDRCNRSTLPRIAMVSTHGYVAAQPPLGKADTGGQVVYVLELAKKLADMGYEVDIWTRRFEDQPEVDVMTERVRVLRVPCGGKDFIPKEYIHRSLKEWARKVLATIRKHDVSYVFINSHYWDAGYASQLLAEPLATPHVHTPHSLGQWKQKQMRDDYPGHDDEFEKQYNFKERIHHETLIYSESDLVIATTPIQTDLLVKDYGLPRDRVRMIPPGYDDNRFYPVSTATRQVARERLGFKGPTVLALGRLARNKGYDLLIRAFAVVAKRIPEARLRIAAGGEQLGEFEQKLMNELTALVDEMGLRENVVFDHFIPDADLPDWYRAADCFVLCSRYEPFGMTAVESMACGTPTVVTCHGGLWRTLVFGVHALVADPFDAEDLGITITKVLRLRGLDYMLRTRAPRRARATFTWTGIAQQLLGAAENRGLRGLESPDFAEGAEGAFVDFL